MTTSLDRLRAWVTGTAHDGEAVSANSAFVVGLGRFGTSLASELVGLGVEVLAVDVDQEIVNEWSGKLTHVRVADATNANTLIQLGAANFDVAVVAIGTGIEASILTTAALKDVGVKHIWAKAITNEHGRILERVGADEVVYPEKEMGARVAHIVTGEVLDYFELDDGFVLAEMRVPSRLLGKPLGDSNLRRDHSVTAVCIKPRGGAFTYASSETVPSEGAIMVIAGGVDEVTRFVSVASK